MHTDEHRLQQILRNLVSNAVKFTEHGTVRLIVEPATKAQVSRSTLVGSDVIAFSVVDTGIGIPTEKLRVIFEAFQQADGTTSRRYGGTGLGLTISREIAHLLGGEIQAASRVGEGSTFTLLLPVDAFPEGGCTGSSRRRAVRRCTSSRRGPRARSRCSTTRRSPRRRCSSSTTTSATCSR